MGIELIRTWKYKNAPANLKKLHPAGLADEWVMEVPKELCGEVEAVLGENEAVRVSRHEMPSGSWIFFGQSASDALASLVAKKPATKARTRSSDR